MRKTSSGPIGGGGGEAECHFPLLTKSPFSVPSCVSFSIYTPWGKHCEHLSLKLGAFFGILFGALGALLLLGVIVFVVHHFWGSKIHYSYSLDSES